MLTFLNQLKYKQIKLIIHSLIHNKKIMVFEADQFVIRFLLNVH